MSVKPTYEELEQKIRDLELKSIEHERLEERQRLSAKIFEILNKSGKSDHIIRNILLLIKDFAGFDAAGIRLREGEDFPYYEASGFEPDFLKAETYLCARNRAGEIIRDSGGNPFLECICGTVISGKTDYSPHCFTKNGSFWTNSTSEMLCSSEFKAPLNGLRGRCNKEGYESVALMPLRSDREIIGLLQLNDRRKGMFTPDLINFFEGIGSGIGIALARIQAEEQLRLAIRSTEAANRAKTEFLANISHEIRTPMNAVIGMIDLTLATGLQREQRDFLETARISADSLMELLNDILDFSRIEAGCLLLEDTDFDLRMLLETLLKTLSVRAHQKGLELACHIAQDVPTCLRADPHRLRQILVNLAGNAIKFTEKGEVVVRVENKGQDAEKYCLHFSVTDTGIGIPHDQMEKIFDRFSQADGSATRRYGGTGLGTAISKQLAEIMEGSIWVESRVGVGSTFHFTIKARPARDIESSPAPSSLKGMKILIVDDNATNRLILREMISSWGVVPIEAESGSIALKYLEEMQDITMAVLDVNMPDMNGYELAQQIRRLPRAEDMLIIFLTSSDWKEEPLWNKELGKTVCLAKPVRQSELLEAVLNVPKTKQEPEIAGQGHISAADRKLRILLAEDNIFNRKLAVSLLEMRGHEVVVAHNGKEAVEIFEREHFDLILMDVQMPEMDGIEATRVIRNKEKVTGGHIPIVAMTALVMQNDRDSCLMSGMDSYIPKPIRRDEFFAAIEGLVMSEGPPPTAPDKTKPDEVLSREELLEIVGGDHNLMKKMATMYIETLPEQLSRIQESIAARDSQGLRFSAHSLKGMSLNLSAKIVSGVAYRLEKMGRAGDLAQAAEVYDDLEKESERLKKELVSLVKN